MIRNGDESVIRVLLLQAQYDLTQAIADVTAAGIRTAQSDRAEKVTSARCEAVVGQLRQIATRTRIDPALLGSIRSIYRSERTALSDARARLHAAREEEDRARAIVAELRSQERTFAEALRQRKNKKRQMQRDAEVAHADELWLQRYGVPSR